MKQSNVPHPDIKECRCAATALNGLLDLVFEYDQRKGLSRASFRQLDLVSEGLEGWNDRMDGQFKGVLSSLAVLGPLGHGPGFWRSWGSQLSGDHEHLARIWTATPWRLVAFHVTDKPARDLVRVRPLGPPPERWTSDWETLWVFSPNIYARKIPESDLVLTLLVPGFGAWHTYGPIISLPGWGESDLRILMAMDQAQREGGKLLPLAGLELPEASLSDLLTRAPLTAELTVMASQAPRITTPQGPAEDCTSVVSLPGSPGMDTVEVWVETLKSRGITTPEPLVENPSFEIPLGEGGALRAPWITVVPRSSLVYLRSLSLQAYREGQALLEGLVDFPRVPQRRMALGAVILAKKILENPWDLLDLTDLERKESGEESRPDEDESLKLSQRIWDRLVRNHNEGLGESPEESARVLGVPLDQVLALQKILNSSLPPRETGTVQTLLDLPPRALKDFTTPGILEVPGYLEKTWREAPVESSPVMKVFRWLVDLSLFSGGRIPATAAGYLSPETVKEAVPRFRERDPVFPPGTVVKKEGDWRWLGSVRRLLELCGFLTLGREGFLINREAALNLEDGVELWTKIFSTALYRWNWPEDLSGGTMIPHLEQFTLVLFYSLGRLSGSSPESGGWVDMETWARVYPELLTPGRQAFAGLPSQEAILMGQLVVTDLENLVLAGPLGLLGLAEIHPQDLSTGRKNLRVRVSPLALELFRFLHPKNTGHPGS